MAGRLHTEINVRHRELNLDTVAHLSANRAQRRLTSFIEANALITMQDHQPVVLEQLRSLDVVPDSLALDHSGLLLLHFGLKNIIWIRLGPCMAFV